MRSAPGASKQHDDSQRRGYLAFGLHVQQQVVDYVEDHGILGRVRGDLQVVVDKRERVHSSCRDTKRTRGAPVGPEVVSFGGQPEVEGQGASRGGYTGSSRLSVQPQGVSLIPKSWGPCTLPSDLSRDKRGHPWTWQALVGQPRALRSRAARLYPPSCFFSRSSFSWLAGVSGGFICVASSGSMSWL